MKTAFKYSLTEEEVKELGDFYASCENVTIEQHPQWRLSTESPGRYCFFIAREDDKIICTTVITEEKKLGTKTASIDFGPLFKDPEALIASIEEISRYYKLKGFTVLTMQLAMPTGHEADYVEYKLNKDLDINYSFDRNNWSSIVVDLSQDEDKLLRNLSKGHRSDIKKAQKSGLTVSCDYSEEDFKRFIEVYINMHRERQLKENDQGSAVYLGKVRDFFNTYQAGKFLIVKDETGTVLGGILLVHQNKTMRYFKGASDPAVRNLPVLHLAIWEAIRSAKQQGYQQFDLWGYNHFVDESDQVFFINRFKKGFGGNFTFYPKKMYFIFKPLQHKAYITARHMYHKFRKK